MAQHYFYSGYFTRYLCAMMASLPDNSDVKAICENLFEEMGFEDATKKTHTEIYAETMRLCDVFPKDYSILSGTKNLIRTMFEYCRSNHPLHGLAALCLGAEAIVPLIYRDIVSGCQSVGFDESALEYFYLHMACDDAHSLTMRKIIDRLISENPSEVEDVRSIACDMIAKRIDFFSDISNTDKPHILALS